MRNARIISYTFLHVFAYLFCTLLFYSFYHIFKNISSGGGYFAIDIGLPFIICLAIAYFPSLGIASAIAKRIFKYDIDNDVSATKTKWLETTAAIAIIIVSLLFSRMGDFEVPLPQFLITVGIPSSIVTAIYLLRGKIKQEPKLNIRSTVNPDPRRADYGRYQQDVKEREKGYSVIGTGDEPPARDYDFSYGSAWWIPDYQKNQLTANRNGTPSYEGLWLGGGYFDHNQGNLVTLAPPGSGKGGALIIPNLLWKRDYPHSFFVFDPKGTNACITAKFQARQQGQRVIIIDPMRLQEQNGAKHGIGASSFNPLDFIKFDMGMEIEKMVAIMLPKPPQSNGNDEFFLTQARSMLNVALHHFMTAPEFEGNRNLVEFNRQFSFRRFLDFFENAKDNMLLSEEKRSKAADYIEMQKHSESQFSGIISSAFNALHWINNEAIQRSLMHSDFHPMDLAEGGVTLYLCQPIANKEQFAVFSRLIIDVCLTWNLKPSNKPKSWVYYLLDEFPTIGQFPEIESALAVSREYKMRIWLFGQSLSQFDAVYGHVKREGMIGNIGITQAFSITDVTTQEYISKRVGKTTKYSSTRSHQRGQNAGESGGKSSSYGHSSGSGHDSSNSSSGTNSGWSKGDSYSESYNEVKVAGNLIEPHEVGLEPHIITIIKDVGPMRLVRWQYWQNGSNGADKTLDYYAQIFKDGRAAPNPNFG